MSWTGSLRTSTITPRRSRFRRICSRNSITRGRRFLASARRRPSRASRNRRNLPPTLKNAMTIQEKTLKVCSCNKTIPLDANALAAALKRREPIKIHTELCRKEAGSFQASLADPDVFVACTQEAPLFGELAQAADSKADLRFVNIREAAGWSAEGVSATPKMAALLAAAALPEPEPVPNVEYKSGGHVLIIGPSSAPLQWAARLS